MRQPSLTARRIGTKGFCAVSGSAAALITGAWVSGDATVPSFLPFLLIALAVNAFKARREVEAFDRWQGNWNALAGITEPVKASRRRRQHPVLALWVLLLVLAAAQPFPAPADNELAQTAFVLMTLWGVGRFIWRRTQRLSTSRARATASDTHIVHTPLPVPRRSPSVREAFLALPDYCVALLRRPRGDRTH